MNVRQLTKYSSAVIIINYECSRVFEIVDRAGDVHRACTTVTRALSSGLRDNAGGGDEAVVDSRRAFARPGRKNDRTPRVADDDDRCRDRFRGSTRRDQFGESRAAPLAISRRILQDAGHFPAYYGRARVEPTSVGASCSMKFLAAKTRRADSRASRRRVVVVLGNRPRNSIQSLLPLGDCSRKSPSSNIDAEWILSRGRASRNTERGGSTRRARAV